MQELAIVMGIVFIPGIQHVFATHASLGTGCANPKGIFQWINASMTSRLIT